MALQIETIDDVIQYYKNNQNFALAIIGGITVGIICSIIWAAVTVISGYQIGWMAIGVGFLVGFSVQYFGRGIDTKYQITASIISIASCLFGNVFGMVWMSTGESGMSFIPFLFSLSHVLIIESLIDSFSIIDVLFYGLAIYESIKFSVIRISVDLEQEKAFIEGYENGIGKKIRYPLAFVYSLIIVVCAFWVQNSNKGDVVITYESGETRNKGYKVKGKEHGEWKFYYEDGNLSAKQNYSNGLQVGTYESWYENGIASKLLNYSKGMAHGKFETYFEDGNLDQKGEYKYDRLEGPWETYFKSGKINEKMNYKLDRLHGDYQSFFENGQMKIISNYDMGDLVGLYEQWDSTGSLLKKFEYDKKQSKILFLKNSKKKAVVKNGNGFITEYDTLGQKINEGKVKNGLREGHWKEYYSNGKLKTVSKYTANDRKVLQHFDKNGTKLVENGSGIVPDTSSTLLTGELRYENGKLNGEVTYKNFEGGVSNKMTYKDGKLNGDYLKKSKEGTPLVEGKYVNDARDGVWKWYHENGEISSQINYVHEKKDGEQLFKDYYGTPLKVERYKMGEYVETEVLVDDELAL